MMTADQLSPADVAALQDLRLRLTIRIDQACGHAEALQRMALADAVDFGATWCNVTVPELTPELRALGFRPDGSVGPKGQRYCYAPQWVWCSFKPAFQLLREAEGRSPPPIGWTKFLRWFDGEYKAGRPTTVGAGAAHFKVTAADMADAVDGFYWAFRLAPPGMALELQPIELDGE
jgi:hypothetical protein